MRVVTWNVQHARRGDNGEPDPIALAGVCMRLEADVLALQEVDRCTARVRGADLLEIVADATGLTPVDGAVVAFEGGTYGNALLVRGEPAGAVVVELPRPWRAEPRVVVTCRVGALAVACCHLGLGRGEAARQLGAALAVVPSGPAVLLGDLNLGPPSVSAVLTSAGQEWSQLDVPPAFPSEEPAQAIDHILLRGIAGSPAPSAACPAVSDHRPVIAELRE